MSAPTDPSAGWRKRERIHRENLAAFDDAFASKRRPSAGRSSGYSGNGSGFIGLLMFGALVYASDWIRAQYFPGGDPIYRILFICIALTLVAWFGLWILGPFFRTRVFRVLLAGSAAYAFYWLFA